MSAELRNTSEAPGDRTSKRLSNNLMQKFEAPQPVAPPRNPALRPKAAEGTKTALSSNPFMKSASLPGGMGEGGAGTAGVAGAAAIGAALFPAPAVPIPENAEVDGSASAGAGGSSNGTVPTLATPSPPPASGSASVGSKPKLPVKPTHLKDLVTGAATTASPTSASSSSPAAPSSPSAPKMVSSPSAPSILLASGASSTSSSSAAASAAATTTTTTSTLPASTPTALSSPSTSSVRPSPGVKPPLAKKPEGIISSRPVSMVFDNSTATATAITSANTTSSVPAAGAPLAAPPPKSATKNTDSTPTSSSRASSASPFLRPAMVSPLPAHASAPTIDSSSHLYGNIDMDTSDSVVDDPAHAPSSANSQGSTSKSNTSSNTSRSGGGSAPSTSVPNPFLAKTAPAAPSSAAAAAARPLSTMGYRKARADFDFEAQDADELELKAGDVVSVVDSSHAVWWYGGMGGRKGHFPAQYVTMLPEEVVDDTQIYANASVLRQRRTVPRPVSTAPAPATTTNAAAAATTTSSISSSSSTTASFAATSTGPSNTSSVISDSSSTSSSSAPTLSSTITASPSPAPPRAANSTGGRETGGSVSSGKDANGESRSAGAGAGAAGLSGGAAEGAAEDMADEEVDEDILFCRVLYAYEAIDSSQLQLRAGDIIEILTCDPAEPWWSGVLNGKEGWFPASYVELLESVEEESDTEDESTPAPDPSEDSRLQKARLVINEVVETERVYVNVLEAIIKRYLMAMRPKVGTLFLEKSIDIIFSNIEQLSSFHVKFLEDLEKSADMSVGACFERHAEGFKIYAIYCNNFPRAEAELARIQDKDEQILAFLSGCRLLSGDSFELGSNLLKPVQRVLKYPMLLRELLKTTPPGHKDFASTSKACAEMEKIAATINEEKRHKERITQLQKSIDDWEGAELTDTSTMLLHEGTLTKISQGHIQERYFYLFDNVFLYCKRTVTGRQVFKGKIFTDNITVEDLPDGEKAAGRVLRNAFRIYNKDKEKWLVLYAKTPEEKNAWLEAFLLEREKVRKDKEEGISLVAREVASDKDESAVKARQRMLHKALAPGQGLAARRPHRK